MDADLHTRTRLEQAIETLVCLGKWDDGIERDEPFTWTVERQAEVIQRAIDADFDSRTPFEMSDPPLFAEAVPQVSYEAR